MKHYQKDDDTFVIGWIGSRTTSVYILEILPAIKKFVETYKNIRFDLVGFDKSLLPSDVMREISYKYCRLDRRKRDREHFKF